MSFRVLCGKDFRLGLAALSSFVPLVFLSVLCGEVLNLLFRSLRLRGLDSDRICCNVLGKRHKRVSLQQRFQPILGLVQVGIVAKP